MNTLTLPIVSALIRTGIVLSVTALVVAVCLRVFRVASPAVRRITYVAVLLQGWLLLQGPFSLPLPSSLAKLVEPSAVGWDQRRPPVLHGWRAQAHQLQGEEKVVSGTEHNKTEPLTDGDFPHVSKLESSGCHWPASVFGSKSTAGLDEGIRSSPAVRVDSTLATSDKSLSFASPKSTDGPKSARGGPVAPELGPLESVVVSVDKLPANEPAFPWSLALVSLWAAGIVFIAGRSAWGYWKFVRRFPASGETPPEWADEWASLQLEAGLPGVVPLVVAEHAGPVLCRLPRGYCLIVPGEAWRTLEPSQRLLILRHELAHIERRDVWKSLAARILALPHWFNPLAWRMVRRFDESAEWACDEAAAGATPERIPDYARALLQLGHRAQPAFFASSAARTQGLAGRIRRLLTPGAKKETKMKLALMATLLLGISVINVTRLQTRAEGPSAADDKQQTALAPPAAADKPAATVQDSQPYRGVVTLQAPVIRLNVVRSPVTKFNAVSSPVTKLNVVSSPVTELHTVSLPVTKANTVPAPTTITVVLPPASPAKPAAVARRITIMVPHSETIMVPATVSAAEPKQVGPASTSKRADQAGPSAGGEEAKSRPAGATPPTKTVRHNPRPGKTVRLTGKALMRVGAGSNTIEMADGEIRFLEGGTGILEVTTMPREARVNLPYILQHMHRYQRDQDELKASLAEMEKWHETEGKRIDAAKTRIEAEKDPIIRSFLEKGISQSSLELRHEDRERRNQLILRETESYRTNMQAILGEITRYAKEHKILVVRRMPFANEKKAAAPVSPPQANNSEGNPGAPQLAYLDAPSPVMAAPDRPGLLPPAVPVNSAGFPSPTDTYGPPAPVQPPPGSAGLALAVPATSTDTPSAVTLPPPAAAPPVMPPAGSTGLRPPIVPAASTRAAAGPMPSAGPGVITGFRQAVPLPITRQLTWVPTAPEILYVAELHGDANLDISDEIVKRLNAADEAKGKTPGTTPK